MNREETDETPRIPVHIAEPQQRHVLVLVILVPGPLGRGVSQVSRWGPINVSIQDCCISDGNVSRREILVGSLHSEDRTGHDGISGLLDVT